MFQCFKDVVFTTILLRRLTACKKKRTVWGFVLHVLKKLQR
jgi:hypothetical protein